jgi:hypothetical protein
MKNEEHVLGHLIAGTTRFENHLITIPLSGVPTGRMSLVDGVEVGDRYRFEAIDGREAEIEICDIVPPNVVFAFVRPLDRQKPPPAPKKRQHETGRKRIHGKTIASPTVEEPISAATKRRRGRWI